MEQNKYLGIYIASDKTTVVLAGKTAGKIEVFDYFSVTPETPAQPPEQDSAPKFSFADTAAKIASLCAEKQFIFANVAVAVDCRLYRQQKLHSEFQEYRQIAQTIKFDAEEALAVDAAQTAIAFELIGKQLSGSDVSTYAAGADLITEIIKSLQNNKLDPVTVEPDAICLRRIIDNSDAAAIIAAVSHTRCFMICPAGSENKPAVRSFLTSPSQNKTSLFTSQILLTISSLNAETRAAAIKAWDTTGNLDLQTLAEQTSMTAENLDITQKLTLPANLESQDGQAIELVIAAGAAAAFAAKTDKVDFRADFMPYQGKKQATEKIVKIAGIAATAVFIILGIILQMKYFAIGRDIRKIENKFKGEFIIAMPGAKFTNSHDAAQRLSREINKIKAVNTGMLSASGEDSILAKMTYLFEALNSVPPGVDINIEKISITTKTMSITGSTNMGGNLQFFGAFDKHPKLTRGSTSVEPKDGKDNFRLTLELKQGPK